MVKNSGDSSIGVPHEAPLSVERAKATVLPLPRKVPGEGNRRQTM
jgi:hypothetical protein